MVIPFKARFWPPCGWGHQVSALENPVTNTAPWAMKTPPRKLTSFVPGQNMILFSHMRHVMISPQPGQVGSTMFKGSWDGDLKLSESILPNKASHVARPASDIR